MSTIIADRSLIAACGLYCGACGQFLKGKCPGCAKNEKATWCGIRSCVHGSILKSCADCSTYQDVNECKKFNNFISKIFGFIFKSNRKACIDRIRVAGYDAYASEMAQLGKQSLPR